MNKSLRCFLIAFTAAKSSAFAPINSSARTSATISTSLSATTAIAEGLTKNVIKEGNGPPLRLGEVATVSYNCVVSATQQPFAKSPRQKVVIGDGVMIDGWEKALSTMSVGEKSIVYVDGSAASVYGYGSDGVGDIVPPNAALELEIEILEAEEQKNMGMAGQAVTGMTGSGELGALDPMKPRTPDAIAAAYAARQEQMILEQAEKKEGLEGWIEKAKTFYFFGFFEGETGEKAPWILRPSITFPIAFAVVGAGFWVTFALGGISERGTQVKDELDDIVLSYAIVKNTLVLAFAEMSK
eukprot:CAMPEP_0194073590 /NCGR_PEP_ID=MMETSP0149-20130528/954_1 /TAXON_ID=122233 /ORGANISM="Chaetoceros debilis, Strain MM31A-1" /LENGTH=297 /DNA_ID=CAMNT_0038753621 /DNA_START=87 /DNA_END=980 /DNA_ORIENTATION=-